MITVFRKRKPITLPSLSPTISTSSVPIPISTNGGQEEPAEFVETDTKGKFSLIVGRNSMEPEFREGDVIVVDPYKKQEQNDYVVVCKSDYKATLKQ